MASSPPSRPSSHSPTRAGYVALVGWPNVGKSTLMNRMVGEKLSIVTPKAQTTWSRVTGIQTDDHRQSIFLDTPGLLEARGPLQRSMLEAARTALAEADVVLVVLDATRRLDDSARGILEEELRASGAPRFAAINKIDAALPEAVDAMATWARESLAAETHRISALEGTGVDELREAVARALPEGPFLFPEDEVASEPVRFFVSELVRETIFERYHQEIPYSTYCQVEEFRESEDPVYIRVLTFVERNSQKGILVGEGGSAIRELGRVARQKIEDLLGRRVYLDLWVKVLPGWRRKRSHLKRLGFHVPGDHETIASS